MQIGVRVSSFERSNTASPRCTLDALFCSTRTRADQSPDDTPVKDEGVAKVQEAGPPCDIIEAMPTECSTQHRVGPSGSHDDVLGEGGGPATMLECPVCGKCVTEDNKAMNRHIDECLNVSAINTLQDTERGQLDGVHCTTGTPTWKKSAIKRKSGDQAHTSVKKLTTLHTLHHFWNAT